MKKRVFLFLTYGLGYAPSIDFRRMPLRTYYYILYLTHLHSKLIMKREKGLLKWTDKQDFYMKIRDLTHSLKTKYYNGLRFSIYHTDYERPEKHEKFKRDYEISQLI